ncbi:MAG: phenylacetate--CoA ligase family protein [Patescibacteria group bacterium]
MFNWRKIIIYFLWYITGSKVPDNLKRLRRMSLVDQRSALEEILLHAYNHVPYYHKILSESGVVDNGQVNLDNFNRIPLLTKDIIRQEGANLYSDDYQKRKFYQNTSGGSTGEPVKFLQDQEYWELVGIALKIFYHEIYGKKIGEPEIIIWGSERDIFRNSLSWKERIINFLYNRTILNFFRYDDQKLASFIATINKVKPVSMWAYAESLDVISNYIKKNNLSVYSPKFIISTAGTLFPEIRQVAQEAFHCPVYNQYGSMEVGGVAIELEQNKGLYGFPALHYLEVIDGEVVVTLLVNFTMPIIRYKIGDTAIPPTASHFNNHNLIKVFDDVTGRTISHFKTESGQIINARILVRQFWFKDWIKKFQMIQKDRSYIICNVVLASEPNNQDIDNIKDKIKVLFGQNCCVDFNFVDQINPSKSGKYFYTYSEVK